jgi:serine/threonine-protein kinase PknK
VAADPRADGDVAEIPGYRLLEPVGRGGFSVVYHAYQHALDRHVAVKLLTVDYLDARARKRFLREVQLTTRLTGHPNVVTVLDAGVTQSRRPYLVMDFFERGSLQDRLERDGPLPATEAARIGVKICGALAAAHDLGILHRDIKPQNILASRYGEPALADFGVASLVSAARTSETDALTPYHAAPEVLDGAQPGPSADIYSLGSTLYQLLAGAPAYRQDSDGIAGLLLRILNEPPPPLNRPDIPPYLRDAIGCAMSKDPARRFATAAAFGTALGGSSGVDPGRAGPGRQPTAGPSQLARTILEPPEPAGGEPAGGDPGRTVLRRGRELSRLQSRQDPQRPSWHRSAAIAAATLVAAMATILVITLLNPQQAPRHQRARPAASRVAPAVLATARPTGLSATAEGPAVRLRWRDRPGASYPLFVQISPRPADYMRSVGTGTETALVTGLNPAKGYCFEVGAVIQFGNPSIVAWSAPACTRGATALADGDG